MRNTRFLFAAGVLAALVPLAGFVWAQVDPDSQSVSNQLDPSTEVADTVDNLPFAPGEVLPQGFDPRRFRRHMTGTDTCLLCHGSYNPIVRCDEDPRHIRCDDSKRHSLWIDSALYHQSVHARYGCQSCHTTIDAFGHRIEGQGKRTQRCTPCHAENIAAENASAEEVAGKVAQMKLFAGLDTTLTSALRACLDCHADEFAEYQESVHGVSVQEHHDSDAPFCMDCHGIHYILPASDDRSLTNPANVPATCLNCHNQADLKARAGLTRDISTSFEESFHGKRGELGDASVAVCSSCHGSHAVYAPTDPRSRVNQSHLARTCSECHEGAQLNFATAFTHKTVNPTEQLGLYILQQIYKWVIFLLIAQFLLFVALDLFQLYRHRRQDKDSAHA